MFFVLSVTETNMMFITPIPPTRSPMEPENDHDQECHRSGLAELLYHLLRRRKREIVRLVCR
jgi:hypothetical protein